MREVKIALLGFGTVGAGVYKAISGNRSDITHREGMALSVKRALIKNFDCEPNVGLAPRETFVTDIDEIVNDDEIEIVVECMGGVEPARTFILKALGRGKTVVTSNKEVIAKNWPELEAAAKRANAGLYIEATAGGGVPIIRTLVDAMQANNISTLMGIINGTTNYILTKMSEEGLAYSDALKQAQELGYAEADPTADVEGWDVTYKLSILSSIAFHARVPIEVIYREGITKISPEDIQVAKELGYSIKMLAIGKKGEDGIQARVHPVMLPAKHPLSSVRGSFNAIFLTGNNVDDIMLYGRGAGQMPTASAMVSDIIYACHNKPRYMTWENTIEAPKTLKLQPDYSTKYYLRLTVDDKPGVLAQICTVFAEHGVSLDTVIQRDATKQIASLIFITHRANELSAQAAFKQLSGLDVVRSVDNVIRVEA